MTTNQGLVVWLTGLPASGKSTLAKGLIAALQKRGETTLWLDSDDLRAVLTPQATYEESERDRFYQALGHIAVLGAGGGATVVVSATAPRRRHRDPVRERVERFVEVLVDCDIEILAERDPKGLYRRAAAGEIQNLPGVDMEYEYPCTPELTLNSGLESTVNLVDHILRWLDASSPRRSGT